MQVHTHHTQTHAHTHKHTAIIVDTRERFGNERPTSVLEGEPLACFVQWGLTRGCSKPAAAAAAVGAHSASHQPVLISQPTSSHLHLECMCESPCVHVIKCETASSPHGRLFGKKKNLFSFTLLQSGTSSMNHICRKTPSGHFVATWVSVFACAFVVFFDWRSPICQRRLPNLPTTSPDLVPPESVLSKTGDLLFCRSEDLWSDTCLRESVVLLLVQRDLVSHKVGNIIFCTAHLVYLQARWAACCDITNSILGFPEPLDFTMHLRRIFGHSKTFKSYKWCHISFSCPFPVFSF